MTVTRQACWAGSQARLSVQARRVVDGDQRGAAGSDREERARAGIDIATVTRLRERLFELAASGRPLVADLDQVGVLDYAAGI